LKLPKPALKPKYVEKLLLEDVQRHNAALDTSPFLEAQDKALVVAV